MGHKDTNKDHLNEVFPLPSMLMLTRGTQVGVIIRFKTFYLKVYDEQYEEKYLVQGFRYHEQIPVFEERIHISRFREFASRFTREDYLMSYRKPSDLIPDDSDVYT